MWDLRLKADELAKAVKVFADGDAVIVKRTGGMVSLSAAAGEELHVDLMLSVFDSEPLAWRQLLDYPVNTTVEVDTAELLAVARRAVAVMVGELSVDRCRDPVLRVVGAAQLLFGALAKIRAFVVMGHGVGLRSRP